MRVFRSKLFRIILFVMSLGVVVTAPRSLWDTWQRRDLLHQRQNVRDDLARQNEALRRDLAEAQTPEYVERMSREKLGLIKEGETILLMPNTQSQAPNQSPQENIANWKKWWRLFF